jgi:hypothetical protein
MQFMRRYYDEGKDEIITEAQVRQGLGGTYKDVDEAVTATRRGHQLQTASATYWSV